MVVDLLYLPRRSTPFRRGSNPAESKRQRGGCCCRSREIHSYARTWLRGATGAREKSSYTKINIGSDHVTKQSVRIFVSARPSITLRIRRQTCNARSCRPSRRHPPARNPLAALLVPRHVCTNRRLRGNPLGIHSRSGIRPLLLQNPSVSGHRARGTITG